MSRHFVSFPDARPLSSAAQLLSNSYLRGKILSISHRFHARKNRCALAFFTSICATFARRKFSLHKSLLFPSGCATIGNVHLRFFRRPAVVGRNFLTVTPMRDRSESTPGQYGIAPVLALFPHARVYLGHFAFLARGDAGHFRSRVFVAKGLRMSFAVTSSVVLNPWIQILAALEKKVNRQILRYLAQAHPLQLHPRTHAVRAHSHSGIPPRRRSLRRSDPGSHRKPASRIRRRHLHHSGRRSHSAARP